MTMSSDTANRYFQGKENVAMAIARRRIKTGGDVKAALSLIPITKPIYAQYTELVDAEYPHLRVRGDRPRLTATPVSGTTLPTNQAPGRSVDGSPLREAPPCERRASTADDAGRSARWRRGPRRGTRRSPLPVPARDVSDQGAAAPRSTAEVARRLGVTPATLRRWVRAGVIPGAAGGGRAAVASARIVARLRERGHPLREIREATESGKLAFGYIEDLLPAARPRRTLDQAAQATGLEPALIKRIYSTMGFNAGALDRISEDDVQFLRYAAASLAAGFPLVAFLQLCRVYGQALAQVADAEVRLFHIYVHEPLMREGIPGLEMAEEMEALARELLPLASPMMDHMHQRFLQHFVEQDVIGPHGDRPRRRAARPRAPAGRDRLRRPRRLYAPDRGGGGGGGASSAVERFVEAVEHTLPDDARVIKTIGDEVMVVGSDPAALVDWAVGFQTLVQERPLPRIGIHHGETIYRDGDYYGREVNLAARVAARAAGGEVIVTRPVVDAAGPAPRVRADRRGPPEGLLAPDGALHRASGR